MNNHNQQINKNDFNHSEWIEKNLVIIHPIYFSVKFNIFTKEAFYIVTQTGIHDTRMDFGDFESALEYLNKNINKKQAKDK